MTLRLYTRWQNSAGERVRIALNLKAIGYQYVAVDTLGSAAFAQINPQGLMPALEANGAVITQSSAILDFLETTFPDRPLLPDDPVLRAQSLAFGAIIASEMHALTVNRVRKHLLSMAPDADVASWVRHWLGLGFASLEALLQRRARRFDYCYGDAPGWADLHLVPQVSAARRLGVALDPYRLVLDIDARCSALEAFAQARPEAQPDFPG